MRADLEAHFKGKNPAVVKIYERLMTELKKFGPVAVEPKKTSIHLVNRFAFAGVYARREYINLEIPLSFRLESKRVDKVEKASANRFHHRFKLSSVADLDGEMLGWLRQAYDLKG